MEILKIKNSSTKASTVYNMLKGRSRLPLKQFDGDVMELENYIVYQDENLDGDLMTCVTLREPDGTTWTTNGVTFVRDFQSILEACELAGEKVNAIKIVDGESKKGRNFRTCDMVE